MKFMKKAILCTALSISMFGCTTKTAEIHSSSSVVEETKQSETIEIEAFDLKQISEVCTSDTDPFTLVQLTYNDEEIPLKQEDQQASYTCDDYTVTLTYDENETDRAEKRNISYTYIIQTSSRYYSTTLTKEFKTETEEASVSLDSIPSYTDSLSTIIHDDHPYFEDSDASAESFEKYGELDALGRCTSAFANVGKDLFPTGEREDISSVTPSGFINTQYESVDSESHYLYERCHLIAFMLTGENANEKNLITGTHNFNVNGMLPYENKVKDYIEQTGNHVLYRVTPMYNGEDLVASGVLMEAKSVEDNGEGIEFCVFVYNVQDGIEIDYATGESNEETLMPAETSEAHTYILNTNTKRFHYPDCDSVNDMKDKNKKEVTATREEIIKEGYKPCGNCNP